MDVHYERTEMDEISLIIMQMGDSYQAMEF